MGYRVRRAVLVVLSIIVLLPASDAGAEEAAAAPPRFVSGLIDAGQAHTCLVLDSTYGAWQTICWGEGDSGRLGYADTLDVGDDEEPREWGPVDLGPG